MKDKDIQMFSSTRDLWQNYIRGVMYLRNNTFSLPIDAMSFDHEVGTDELDVMFNSFVKWCKQNNESEAARICLLIWEEYYHKVYINSANDQRLLLIVKLMHGVVSGIRWTSSGDSQIQRQRLNAVSDILTSLLGSKINLFGNWGQGDDLQVFTETAFLSVCVIWCFRTIGIPIHPLKNLLSCRVFEFLRVMGSIYGTSGYATRKIPSILFNKPGKDKEDMEAYVNSICSNIRSLAQRGVDREIVSQLLTEEVVNMFSKYGQNRNDIINMPLYHGGVLDDGSKMSYRGNYLELSISSSKRFACIIDNFGCYSKMVEDTSMVINDLSFVVSNFRVKLGEALVPQGYDNMLDLNVVFKNINNINYKFFNINNYVDVFKIIYKPIQWNNNIEKTIDYNTIISYCFKNYAYKDAVDRLRGFVSADCLDVFDLLRVKMSQKVFIMWLKGDVRMKKGYVLGVSDVVVSMFFEKYEQLLFKQMVQMRHKIGIKDLIQINMSINLAMHQAVATYSSTKLTGMSLSSFTNIKLGQ